MPEPMRQRLHELHTRLMRLHKALLDVERAAYERVHGPVGAPGQMLELVISHQWFAWLHPISELVVHIDEVLDGEQPATAADADLLLAHTRMLLTPAEGGGASSFARKYYDSLQSSPSVVMAHADLRRLLAPNA